jgi:hypothetical protein
LTGAHRATKLSRLGRGRGGGHARRGSVTLSLEAIESEAGKDVVREKRYGREIKETVDGMKKNTGGGGTRRKMEEGRRK